MSFIIPAAVLKRAEEFSEGADGRNKGTRKIEALLAYMRTQLASTDEVVGFTRDAQNRLVAVTAAKPDLSSSPIPAKYRRKTGLS
jgi:hypothetical protein